MYLTVDTSRCQGHGMCYGAAPALLDADEEGYVSAPDPVKVSQDDIFAARTARDVCPESAIALTEG